MIIRIKQCIAWLLGLPLRLFALFLGTEKLCRDCAVYAPGEIPADITTCLILGAKLSETGSLTPMLRKRLAAAAAIAGSRPDMTFLISGTEADGQAMLTYLTEEAKLPRDRIRLDMGGVNTLASIQGLPEDVKAAPFLLLTGRFHMPRSLYICKKLGLRPRAYMMDLTRNKYDYLYLLRERAALVKAWYVLNFRENRD